MNPRTYLSRRGLPLLWIEEPLADPVLTVENYVKWYWLHLVLPDGRVEEVNFGALDRLANRMGDTPYCDHVPNPRVVQRLADDHRWHLDPNALEMLIGRWEIEARGRYQ